MRVLVTGGTGFIGHHLIEALVRRGDDVAALVRSPHKAARLEELRVRIVRGDLDDTPALDTACRDREVVFHVAGVIKARDEAAFFHANAGGTRRLVEAAESAARPRFVLVSSMAAAGPAPRGTPLGGDEPPRPVTAYGRSKLAGEAVVRQSALPWTIVRPPMVYGPRDREFLPIFKLARRGVAAVFGDGRQELSAVYAPDLAEALVAVTGSEACVGGTYYGCHPEVFTSRDFVLAAGRAQGKEPRIVAVPAGLTRLVLRLTGAAARLLGRVTLLNADKANEFLARAWTGDSAALTRDSGWTATRDLSEGLPRTAAWYRDKGWL